MGTQHAAETELLIDCSQPALCDCDDCDTARRIKVRAFCERWFATHPVHVEPAEMEDEESGVRCAPTVRPPARLKKVG